MSSAFVGSPQSRYAAIAIITAVAVVSLSIIFGADAMPLSQKFIFIILICLLSIPGILLSLLQLTCLVTGAGNENKRWWCSLYAWLMSVLIIIYSIVIVVVSIQSVFSRHEQFGGWQTDMRHGANNTISDYPGNYPFNDAAVGSPSHPPQFHYGSGASIDVAEDLLPLTDPGLRNQYIINKQLQEHFENGETAHSIPGGYGITYIENSPSTNTPGMIEYFEDDSQGMEHFEDYSQGMEHFEDYSQGMEHFEDDS